MCSRSSRRTGSSETGGRIWIRCSGSERPPIPELEPAFYDLTEADMDTVFSASNTYFGQEQMTLREIVKALRETYCGSIGAEYMYVSDPAQKRWVQQRLESIRSTPSFSARTKKKSSGD